MFIRLFLLFTIVPLVELTLLIKIGNIFGVLHTIALVVITGVIGAYLARDQGLRVINELKASLATGRAPTDQIIEGALILISAVLLVTPGIITDTIGFLLVIPYTRKIMRDFLKEYFSAKIAQGVYKTYESSGSRVYYKSSGGFSDKGKKLEKDNDDDVIDV